MKPPRIYEFSLVQHDNLMASHLFKSKVHNPPFHHSPNPNRRLQGASYAGSGNGQNAWSCGHVFGNRQNSGASPGKPRGGTPLYVYPEKDDFASGQAPNYWHPTCLTEPNSKNHTPTYTE